jgi:hypothetical protein
VIFTDNHRNQIAHATPDLIQEPLALRNTSGRSCLRVILSLHPLRRKLVNICRRRSIDWTICRTHRRRGIHWHGTRKLIYIRRRRSIGRNIRGTHCWRRVHRHGTRWPTHAAVIHIIGLHVVRCGRCLLRHRISTLTGLLAIRRLSIRVVEL